MLDQDLALIDPLLQEAAPRNGYRGKYIVRLLSSLASLGLAVLLSGLGEQHVAVQQPVTMALQSLQRLQPAKMQVTQRTISQRTQAFGKKTAAPSKVNVIPPSFNFAIGAAGITAGLVAVKAPVALPVFFGALTALTAFQATRVRFTFDNKAMEVCIGTKDGELADSGENFAVGGENRWNYDTFTRWNFVPSESFPVFMYFYETQTNGDEEQFHLFPVIMNGQALGDAMKEKVGEAKMT